MVPAIPKAIKPGALPEKSGKLAKEKADRPAKRKYSTKEVYHRMRLDTKEKRLEYRKSFYTKGCTVVDLPEIEFQAFTTDAPNYYTLTAFRGTAGKPYMNYYYRTAEKRDKGLQEAIESQKERLAYRKQRREENKGCLTESAQTAAAIRARLKKEFPGVKFSVTSDNFSMGNSVDISWTDGPMDKAVSAITDQYEYGRFDGMQDLSYTVEIDTKNLGCPGAKYVHTNRRLSEEYRAQILAVLQERFSAYHGNGSYAPFQWDEAEKILLGIEEPKPEPEVIEPEPEKPSNVIDFTAKAKAKQQAQEAKQEEEAQKDYDYIMAMAQIMTSDQLKGLITELVNNPEWPKETRAAAVRPFLKILADRDSATALELFKDLNIVALMK